MNIRKITLLAASCLSAVAGVFLLNSSPKEQYFPRESNAFQIQEQIHSGYVEYMKSIRNNRQTGSISPSEVSAAMRQAAKMKSGNKSLNITWNFKGPDNVGGRTRAIVIDNADTNHLYAGAVSGGIWESFDGGLSWSAYDNDFKIQNVSSMAQAPNGDVYVGTGPYFDGNGDAKNVQSEFVGNGLWKLTGNGNSELIEGPDTVFAPGTQDPTLSYFPEWATINEIAIDPNNSQRIFVAMNRGLRETTDGGRTWTNPIGITSVCQDVHITADGKIAVAFAGSVRISTDNGITYNTSTFPNGFRARIELAIAPSNTNIMYAVNSLQSQCAEGVYRSRDAGVTWEKLLNTPNYLGNSISCQGFYDNTIAVYPNDAGKILVGGVTMYQWRQSSVDPAPVQGEWKSIATTNEFFQNGARNIFYVHADKHYFLFHPTNPNKLFIGSDGGVGFSDNMNSPNPTYGQYNAGYNVTQFYDIGVGPNDLVAGGTQDNGTQLIGLNFNTGKSAVQVRGGDGFDTELFSINTELGIASLYFGGITRIQGIGSTVSGSTFNNATVTSGRLDALCDNGPSFQTCSQVFYSTVAKWESFNHLDTKDSVLVRDSKTVLPPLAANTVIQYASKNNKLPLQATLTARTFPKDTTTIVPNSSEDTLSIAIDTTVKVVTFINAFDTITVDENNMTVEIRYRGKVADSVRTVLDTTAQGDTLGLVGDVVQYVDTAFIDTIAFVYSTPVLYNNIFHNELSRAVPPRSPLSINVLKDPTGKPSLVYYVDPNVEFNYEFEFPDLVQSTVALFNVKGRLTDASRHVWISKDLQKGSEVSEPRWIKVAGTNSVPNPTPTRTNPGDRKDAISAVFSNDGDKLFYGTTGGELYRIDNLNDIDLSQILTSFSDDYTIENTTTHQRIFEFGNRAVTGIAVDPNNDDNVIVTLGNYGSQQYVHRSTNATAISGVEFVHISGRGSGKLPNSPVYEAVIDFRDNNKVIVGTELGVFATENAFTSASYPVDTTYIRQDTNTIVGDTTFIPADTVLLTPADTLFTPADTTVVYDTLVVSDTIYIPTQIRIDSSVVPPDTTVLDSAMIIRFNSLVKIIDTTYTPADTNITPAVFDTIPADTIRVPTQIIITQADTIVGTRPDVTWTEENVGLGRAPVMSVKQMTLDSAYGAINQGKLYIGTHGRGIFESSVLVGVAENERQSTQAKKGKDNLIIYPNPAVNNLSIKFDGSAGGSINVQIFSLRGQLVRELQPTNTVSGVNTMKINVEDLSQGTYIIRTMVDGTPTTGKFIKQ